MQARWRVNHERLQYMFKIKDLTDQLWDSGVSGGHKETEHTNESVLTFLNSV